MSHEENHDDPVAGWVYFIGVLGILILLVSVYFVHGLYYSATALQEARDLKEGPKSSSTLDMTWVPQREALGKAGERADPQTEGMTYPTIPVEAAMKLVQEDLRKTQAK